MPVQPRPSSYTTPSILSAVNYTHMQPLVSHTVNSNGSDMIMWPGLYFFHIQNLSLLLTMSLSNIRIYVLPCSLYLSNICCHSDVIYSSTGWIRKSSPWHSPEWRVLPFLVQVFEFADVVRYAFWTADCQLCTRHLQRDLIGFAEIFFSIFFQSVHLLPVLQCHLWKRLESVWTNDNNYKRWWSSSSWTMKLLGRPPWEHHEALSIKLSSRTVASPHHCVQPLMRQPQWVYTYVGKVCWIYVVYCMWKVIIEVTLEDFVCLWRS